MMKAARRFKPDVVVHLGDLCDCYSISDYDRDPRRGHNLLEETTAANYCLNDLDSLGAEDKIFCEGNHEDRLNRYLVQKAPALLGVTDIQKLLGLKDRGWKFIKYGKMHRVGKLWVTHDVGRCGISAVRQSAQLIGSHNLAFGHTHRLEILYHGNVLGGRYVCGSFGWLGDEEEATYLSEAQKASWTLGFGVGYQDKDGKVYLQTVPIVDGECCLEGKVYR